MLTFEIPEHPESDRVKLTSRKNLDIYNISPKNNLRGLTVNDVKKPR